MYRTLETDVLVIGGGGAGATAAVKAHEAGARVLMVVKGFVGKSGCSIFASHLPYYDLTTQEKAAARFEYPVRYYNHYLVDQDHVKRMGQYVRTEFFADLEKLGVYWRRTADGRWEASPNLVPVSVVHKQGASGTIIMDKRRRQIISLGIPLLEETMITSLLLRDNTCVGAMALNCRTGELTAISAKAVILATGHSDYLATRATGTREQAADGISMALRAGAEVINLEIQWWHISDVASPPAWMRYHLYPNPLLGTPESSRVYNSRGEVFFEQKTHNPGSSAPYVHQLRLLALEVQKGQARWDGGYYTGYTHIDPEIIRMYQHQAKVWDKLGLDVGKDLIECGITLHMRQGGVNINTLTMETTVSGLFAPGGVGGHYLGGLGPVTYDGKVAAESAVERARAIPMPALPRDQADAEQARLLGLLVKKGEDGCFPVQVKSAIRQVMWEKMGYVKDEQQMTEALAGMERIRAEMAPRMGLQSTSRNWNTGWVDAIDVYNMLDACAATIRSGLYRKESRGPFYRQDYPVVDNENWLVKVIQRLEDGEARFRTEPYATPYLKPRAMREPFFATDY